MKKKSLILFSLFLVLVISGCSNTAGTKSEKTTPEKIVIVVEG